MVYNEDGNYILKPLLTLPVVDNNAEPIIIPKGDLIVSNDGFLIDWEQGGGKKSLRKKMRVNTPFRIENAQCNVAFSLKSAHFMGRLNEKRCKKTQKSLRKKRKSARRLK